jgi:hypothetical protein
MLIFLLCLIVVPLPQGKNPFAAQLNNNNNLIYVTRYGSMARCCGNGYEPSGSIKHREFLLYEIVNISRKNIYHIVSVLNKCYTAVSVPPVVFLVVTL